MTAPPTTAESNRSQGGYGVLRQHDGVTRGATQWEEPPRHACGCLFHFLFFRSYFVIVKRSIYHSIKEYVYVLDTINLKITRSHYQC